MIRRIRKILGLYGAFFRASLTADLEYRLNFLVRIVTDCFWYTAQIASFEVLFNFTNKLGQWNRTEMRVFLGVLFITDAIYMMMFSGSLDQFSDTVRKGDLDLLLTKPVNSQFIISCQRLATAYAGNLLLGSTWLVWSLTQLEGAWAWPRIFWLFLMIPAGITILYSIRFFFSAAAVIFTRAENIQYLWYNLYRLGLRPDNIYYPLILRRIVITVLPVGLIASVPARLVLGIANPWISVWTIAVAGFLLWCSSQFWRFALSRYTSASS